MREIENIAKVILIIGLLAFSVLQAGQGKLRVSSETNGAYIYVNNVKKSIIKEGFSDLLLNEGEQYTIKVQKLSEDGEWLYTGVKRVFIDSDAFIKINIHTKKQATDKRKTRLAKEAKENKIRLAKIKTYYGLGNNFVKLNNKGKELPQNVKNHSCVKDKTTGLIWETKTTDGTVRDYRKTFKLGGKSMSDIAYSGKKDRFGNYEADKNKARINYHKKKHSSDWDSLVNYANKEALCGFKNWRVPTIFELHSLSTYYSEGKRAYAQTWKSDKSDSKRVYVNPIFFPTITKLKHPWYWSSSNNASYSNYAWLLYFGKGYGNSHNIGSYYVRLVQGGSY